MPIWVSLYLIKNKLEPVAHHLSLAQRLEASDNSKHYLKLIKQHFMSCLCNPYTNRNKEMTQSLARSYVDLKSCISCDVNRQQGEELLGGFHPVL